MPIGFEPNYVYEGDEPARLVTLVETGIGIAFIPSTARYAREHITYLPVDHHELVREIAIIWHRDRYLSRAAKEFREVVLEYFDKANF